MSIRKVTSELEAKLKSSTGGSSSGKLERKRYSDGRERLKISLRRLDVPDDSIAVVTADTVEIARLPIRAGSGRSDEESVDSSSVPMLAAGQLIEVRVDSDLVLSGALSID